MNRHAKFDAASFVFGGEIRIRTNKQTNIHTYIQGAAIKKTPLQKLL